MMMMMMNGDFIAQTYPVKTALLHSNDVKWAQWRLRSSRTRLLIQQFVEANNYKNVKVSYYC